jgi:hypothetical protein
MSPDYQRALLCESLNQTFELRLFRSLWSEYKTLTIAFDLTIIHLPDLRLVLTFMSRQSLFATVERAAQADEAQPAQAGRSAAHGL